MSSRSQATVAQAALSPPVVNVFLTLLPITLAVFVSFLTIGLPLPVLPLQVSGTLGMSPLVVGVVIGAQFAAALLSRSWAGNLSDTRGAKRAVITGLLFASASGVAYQASLAFASPVASVWMLLLGRVLLGCGESLIVTGSLSWGIGLVGPHNAGKVMAWNGMAMYGAYAAGAPLGIAVQGAHGFAGISVAAVVLPLLALTCMANVRAVAPTAVRRTPFYKVLGMVWRPGLGLALCSVGFGVITAFIALLFAARDWGNASLAFTVFGLAFIAARILFGHLPDKLGGARVALICVVIEALGQLLIWGAQSPAVAYAGAALTGFGYSLAFPGFGVEAVRRAPPQSRGLAMGAYVAFLDMALGITGPVLGALAGARGIEAVYLAGAIAVALSALVALRLLTSGSKDSAVSREEV
ncbi:arabinose transporter [Comamonas serinivorans]|uniref:Uncharacterized MFS-type transporter CCO03_11255 n=1 Tax=Comamonas serinivorans TaxID=1082851 RepID=A0A1Y0ET87_9BURK|nr:arabinose transporter [Comamonas serinivorans]ARU06796.1 arabinose transporter [Comamonas serinivorans]